MIRQNTQSCCTNLAIASVPIQEWRQLMSPEAAFMSGTIFSELNLPFSKPASRATMAMQRRLER